LTNTCRSFIIPNIVRHRTTVRWGMAMHHPSVRSEFIIGMRDIAPLAVGVGTYGIAFGVLAAKAGIGPGLAATMGVTIFAGSAQIVAVQQLLADAGVAAAVAAGAALNLRLLLMTASLRTEFVQRPLWQTLLGVHMATDENWALMHATRASGRSVGYAYLVGGGVLLMGVWVAATVAGTVFAARIPDPKALGLDFAFTAAFVAVLRSLWGGWRAVPPWVVSAATTAGLIGAVRLEPAWALVIGGFAGAVWAGGRGDA
jgi:4-azaleucine resistance transporter AzlC